MRTARFALGLSFLCAACLPPTAGSGYYGPGQGYSNEPGIVTMGRVFSKNDERTASSGLVGCDPKEVKITKARNVLGVESWTAECKDKRYFCSRERGNTSCTPDTEKDPLPPENREGTRRMVRTMVPPSVPEPEGAAGFDFGQTPDSARAVCEGAGKEWTPGKDYYQCSGTPKEVAHNVRAVLRFCGEELCTIELRAKPESETTNAWIQSFKQLSDVLSKKYGAPNMEERTIPPKCEDRLVSCLREGDASLAYTWDWRKDVLLVLSMNRLKQEPIIRVAYRKKAKEVAPSPVDPSAL